MGARVIGLGVAALLGSSGAAAWAQAAPASTGTPAATPAGAPAANPSAAPGVNAKEQQLLERIRQLKAPRWRSYGVCRYDWSTWRLTEGAVRTTDVECGPENTRAVVAVHCDTLQVSRREGDAAWSPWRLPLSAAESKTTGGEDLMVAALCANITPTPNGGAAPAPMKTTPAAGAAKPAVAKPAAKPAAKSTGNR